MHDEVSAGTPRGDRQRIVAGTAAYSRADPGPRVISASWGSATDVGLVRQHNEDDYLAQFPVFLVADGMGGRAAGEVASGLTSVRFRDLATSGQITVDAVSRALQESNNQVFERADQSEELKGMGTTAVGLVYVEDRSQEIWLVFNVGDSRLYRWYQGSLVQVTTDHTEVQELVDMGSITADEAKSHPLRHVITRAVGTDPSVEPDIWLLPPVPGERFLLCSDGLTGEVADEEIALVLSTENDPTMAATRLVEKAIAAGGHDNVTVVVIDVFGGDSEDLSDTSPGRHGSTAPVEHSGNDVPPTEMVGSEEVAEPAVSLIVDVPRSEQSESTEVPLPLESVPDMINDVPSAGTSSGKSTGSGGSQDGRPSVGSGDEVEEGGSDV